MQSDRWKLIAGTRREGKKAKLFDLVGDSDERVDVARSHTEECITLRQAMNAQAERDAGLLPRIDETLDRLRAIGYVQ